MKYVLMFCETEQWEKDWAAMDQSERDAGFAKVQQWLAEHADKITHNRKLAGPETATTVRLENGEPIITDGPFIEGKEVVRTWPACPLVEIRPVLI